MSEIVDLEAPLTDEERLQLVVALLISDLAKESTSEDDFNATQVLQLLATMGMHFANNESISHNPAHYAYHKLIVWKDKNDDTLGLVLGEDE